jgi:hypothetical protein
LKNAYTSNAEKPKERNDLLAEENRELRAKLVLPAAQESYQEEQRKALDS